MHLIIGLLNLGCRNTDMKLEQSGMENIVLTSCTFLSNFKMLLASNQFKGFLIKGRQQGKRE